MYCLTRRGMRFRQCSRSATRGVHSAFCIIHLCIMQDWKIGGGGVRSVSSRVKAEIHTPYELDWRTRGSQLGAVGNCGARRRAGRPSRRTVSARRGSDPTYRRLRLPDSARALGVTEIGRCAWWPTPRVLVISAIGSERRRLC